MIKINQVRKKSNFAFVVKGLDDRGFKIFFTIGIIISSSSDGMPIVNFLAAFYSRVPVAHVEAGLRTGDPRQPFPEEMNRVLTSRLTGLHFAATGNAAENLRIEGVSDESTSVTGNAKND